MAAEHRVTTDRPSTADARPADDDRPWTADPRPADDDRPSTADGHWTADEMMTVAAARELADGEVCFVGIGLPSTAANLARRLHAPNLVLVYESGTIGAKPRRLPLSIGDGELAATADAVVSVPEIFNYWLQAGRIDVGFLGAAQFDRHANINTTVIGPYDGPVTRLPGAGGAPEIATSCRRVVVVVRQSRRTFVEALSFRTSSGARVTSVITDLGVLTRDPADGELTLTQLHPGVTLEDARSTVGWDLRVADTLAETAPPTSDELVTLRALEATKGTVPPDGAVPGDRAASGGATGPDRHARSGGARASSGPLTTPREAQP